MMESKTIYIWIKKCVAALHGQWKVDHSQISHHLSVYAMAYSGNEVIWISSFSIHNVCDVYQMENIKWEPIKGSNWTYPANKL